MTKRAVLALAAVACAASAASARAGPCAADLYKAQVEIGKRLDAIAAKGKSGAEGNFATLHRQPTPGTVAGAEEKVGDISEADVAKVRQSMLAARKADESGDMQACEKALADVRQALGE